MNKAMTLLSLLLATPVLAATPASQDTSLAAVGVSQKIGAQVPVGLRFSDRRGQNVALAELMNGRPALLELSWYNCPSLCDLSMRRLGGQLGTIDYVPGTDFEVITVSIDPAEQDAAARKVGAVLASSYGDRRGGAAWHVLTGDAESIRALADSIGFHYRYDAGSRQFAHPAGLAVLTADGRISSYLLGLSFSGRDLQLALTHAGQGELGGMAAQFVLRCFHFDPQKGAYTLDVLRIVNLACMFTAAAIAVLVGLLLWHRRREEPASTGIADE